MTNDPQEKDAQYLDLTPCDYNNTSYFIDFTTNTKNTTTHIK